MSETQEQEAAAVAPAVEGMAPIGSLTLSQIKKERRPDPSTICDVCPGSLWYASTGELKCY